MKKLLQPSILVASALFFATGLSYAEPLVLKAGEKADLGSAYWISRSQCKSLLKSFGGVDLLEGPPGIELTIREENVVARRQNCPDPVPGGMVVLAIGELSSKYQGTIKYQVRYKTEDGDQTSTHQREVELLPN